MPRRKIEPEPELPAPPVPAAPPPEPNPALTIVIQSWATPLIGLAMLALGLAAGYWLRSGGALPFLPAAPVAAAEATAKPAGDGSAARQAFMNTLVSQTRHFQGDPNAPVTMIEFADFQCPYCGRHASGTQRLIDSQYVQAGQVRFGYWHMAFLGDESVWSAAASECANDQNAFWKYHDKLFASQSGENQGAFSKDNLKKFAAELGLNTQTFGDCVDSAKYEAQVQADTEAARQIGWSSTPSFVINGQGLVGAQDFNVFQQAIERALTQ
jgi:protein-disulfide isomerase